YSRQTIQVPPRRCSGRGRGTRSLHSRRARHPTETARASLSLEAVSRSLQQQEEPTMSTPADAVPDSLVLAAIERAARHRAPSIPTVPVPVWAITDHLAITRRSRRVRSQLNALEASGAISPQASTPRRERRAARVPPAPGVAQRTDTRRARDSSLPPGVARPSHRCSAATRREATGRLGCVLRDGNKPAAFVLAARVRPP